MIAGRSAMASSGSSHQAFVLSLGLHVSVTAIVLFFAWVKPFERERETIFEVVQIPLGSPDVSEARAPAEPAFALPPPPVRTTPQPESRPQLSPPEPAPPPPQRLPPPRQAPPRVVPRESVAPPPKAAPKAAPKAQPAPPERLSYEEFVKQHGPPKARPPRRNTAPAPTRRSAPRIDTTFSVNLSEALRSPGSYSGSSDAARTALNIYIAALNDRLKQAWNNPQQARTTTVEFDVAANGRISNVRITKSSGSTAFDESVLAAFRAVTSGGPTPDGRPLELRFNFNGVE